MQEYTVKVNGMSCGHCQNRVQQTCLAQPHVQSAVVDLTTGTAQLTTSQNIDQAALIEAIDDAGFEASFL
jgi:copper chaperone CopZ